MGQKACLRESYRCAAFCNTQRELEFTRIGNTIIEVRNRCEGCQRACAPSFAAAVRPCGRSVCVHAFRGVYVVWVGFAISGCFWWFGPGFRPFRCLGVAAGRGSGRVVQGRASVRCGVRCVACVASAGAWVAGRGGVALFQVHFGRVRAVSVPDLELDQAGVRAPVTCTINHILKILTHKESSKGVAIQQGSFTFAADAFAWCFHGQSWYFHGLWQSSPTGCRRRRKSQDRRPGDPLEGSERSWRPHHCVWLPVGAELPSFGSV